MANKTSKKTKKKKTQSKTQNNGAMRTEIKGLIYITMGILILISLVSGIFSSSSAGIIGIFTRKLLFSLIGIGAFILPFVLIYIGIITILKKSGNKFGVKFYVLLVLIADILIFIQNITIKEIALETTGFFPIGYFYNSSSIFHGGILGYIIDYPLYSFFGTLGSYTLIILVFIVSIMILLEISIKDVLGVFLVSLRERSKKEKKEKKKVKVFNLGEDNNGECIITENDLDLHIPKVMSDTQEIATSAIKEEANIPKINLPFNEEKPQSKKIAEKDKEELSKSLEEEIKNNSLKGDKPYEFPRIEFLNENESLKNKKLDKKELLSNATKLQDTLSSFGVNANVLQVTKGPSVTRFEIQPEIGVKVSKIVNLADDIALNLASSGIRIEAPIPGKAAVGIEVPNKDLTSVCIREVVESEEFSNSKKNLAFCLGKDIAGKCVVGDLSKMPHILVAGATGSGKSVCINTIICSLLYKYSPEEVKLLLIDPKVVELNVYNGIPHLLIPVVTDPKKASGALNWAVNEMTRRYNAFADNGVRNIEGYNELVHRGLLEEAMPWIVIIIDELADLMMVCPKDVEDYIARLAQMARAAGMHLVIATQRPSVDVITGMIKANIPSRIAFAVSSQIDSRTIIDSSGAEKLLGKGDMLYYPSGASKPTRIQGAFISEEEVERVVGFIKNQHTEVTYKEEILEEIDNGASKEEGSKDKCDELLNEAINFVVESGFASTSMLQRKYKIGYNRAARIIDEMEERGIISGRNGSKPRQVLISKGNL